MSLRKAREKADKTQEQAAQEAGLSANGWRKLESGKVENPRQENMRAAARAVRVTNPAWIDEFRPAMERLRERRMASEPEAPMASAAPTPSMESPMPAPPRSEADPSVRQSSDRKFVQDEDIVGFVEVEAGNATGVDPAEVNVMEDPELVRIGLRSVLRSIMRHLGRRETDRVYWQVFGQEPPRSVEFPGAEQHQDPASRRAEDDNEEGRQ